MIYDFQKASFLKRFSAFLLDFILVVILSTFFAYIISLTTNYTSLVEEFQGYYTEYETIYNISLTNRELFNNYTEAELAIYQEAIDAMNADEEVLRCWGLVSTLPVVMVSVGLLFSTLIIEFIFPLVFKNGQTIGKKIFKIGVINESGVICSNFQLFARALLGKCAIEYMVPGIVIVMMCFGTMGLAGPILLLALTIYQIVVYVRNPNGCFIHDLVAKTAVCDLSTQMVFKTFEEMVAYREQIEKQKTEAESY